MTRAGCWWATTTPARSSCTRWAPTAVGASSPIWVSPARVATCRASRAVVVSADTGGTERAQLSLLRPDESERLEPLVHDPAYIHTLFDVQPGRVIYSTNRRNGVEFDVIARESARAATSGCSGTAAATSPSAALSPDGRWAVLGRMTMLAASSELLLVDTADGSVVPITDADACPATGPTCNGCPIPQRCWPPPMQVPSSSRSAASSWPTAAGRCWSSQPTANVFGWPSPDGSRLAVVITTDGADQLQLRELDRSVSTGSVAPPGQYHLRRRPIWSPDSTSLGLTFLSPVQPPEVYRWQGGDTVVRCTTSNPDSATAGSDPARVLPGAVPGRRADSDLCHPAAER